MPRWLSRAHRSANDAKVVLNLRWKKKELEKTIEQNCINEGLEELGEILEVFMNHRMKIDGFSSNRWWNSHNMCVFFEIFGPSEKCWSDLYESFWLWVLTEFVWIRWKVHCELIPLKFSALSKFLSSWRSKITIDLESMRQKINPIRFLFIFACENLIAERAHRKYQL